MTQKRASRMKKPLTIMIIGKEVILPVKIARSISIKNNALKSHWKISRNFMTFISYDMLSIKCQKDNLEICLYEVITLKRISCKVCHKTFSPNRRQQIHIERNHKSNWIISNFCFLIWISNFSIQIFLFLIEFTQIQIKFKPSYLNFKFFKSNLKALLFELKYFQIFFLS